MNSAFKIIVIILLLFNGTGAIYGGGQLMLHPDGSTMELSLDLLKHAPFNNYLVPGIILFTVNGLFSFYVIALIVFNFKGFPVYVLAQGIILIFWILVQVIIIRKVTPLHVLLGTIGILLLLSGWAQKKVQEHDESRKDNSLEMY